MEVREPSVKYLSRSCRVLTSAGELPADWIVQPLGELMRLLNGRAFRPDEWSDTGAPIIRIQNLNDPDSDFNFFSGVVDERNVVRPGDLLFAWSGTTGSSFGARVWTGPEGVLNQHIFKVLPDPRKLSSAFAYRLLLKAQYSIERQAHGFKASFVHVKKSDLVSVSAGYPPTLNEQDRVVEALDNVDALIDSLEQLLTKKRQIKQGAMQELLSGTRRLPGFIDVWQESRIGDFTDCTAGGTPSTREERFWGGSIPWMSSGDLHLKRVHDVAGRITEDGLINSSTKWIPERCVLIGLAGQGRTRGTVAMNLIPLCTNQSIAAIFPCERYDTEFLYHNLDWRYEELRELSAGDGGRGGLNLTLIRSITVPRPAMKEQQAIAEVLSDMDTELGELEDRLTKARALKQAMAQALLTGRIRLVEPTA